MRVFIYACEQRYGGYHGIEDYCVEEFDNSWNLDDIYDEYVTEMSYQIMESYNTLDDIDPDDYDSEEEYWEAYIDAQNENVDGYVIPIKDDVTMSIKELNDEACRLGASLFREEYCVKEY